MRCDNCGWSNPEGLVKCQKCNQDLHEVQNSSDSVACMHCGYPLSSANTCCPNCGTQTAQTTSHSSPHAKTVRVLSEEHSSSAAMKATVREIPVELLDKNPALKNVDNAKTVRMVPEEFLKGDCSVSSVQVELTLPGFRLVPLDNLDGRAFQTLAFSGNSVSIVRNDIPGADSSIEDDMQVEFEYENGQWTISEKNGKKVIFVAASHKIGLKSGDVIVIGNRRYIFE